MTISTKSGCKIQYRNITILWIVLFAFQSCTDKEKDLFIENGKMMLSFDKRTGAMVAFRDLANKYEFSGEETSSNSPWQLEVSDSAGTQTIDIENASRFKHRKPNDSTLILEWDRFSDPKAKNFMITAMISLDQNRPMSSWNISVEGTRGVQIKKLVFPRIRITKNDEDEFLAVPEWMGQIIKDPRAYLSKVQGKEKKFEWSYPGPLSLQCAALYNPGKRGFYAACNDTLAFRKNMAFTLDSTGSLMYQLNNYPAINTGTDKYEPSYSSIIGSFSGDWMTAASIYREWGTQQRWCRESRFTTSQTPEWLERNALWVWNRGKSSNVLIPAADLKKRLGLPVSVFWHWWHGCSYDDGFPEYIPPREGKSSFTEAMDTANESGINAIVYMNQALWGTTTESWKNEGASEFSAKNAKGNTISHVFNIFSKKPAAYMCMATQFWKDKYSSLCDSAVNTYKANGVYMDMACLNTMCFDKNHGHPVGGGNYHIEHFSRMTSLIRSKITEKDQLVLAGEGAGEVWLPYLDLFLTLAVSKERYAGVGAWETIPFFQAVYHQYAITYGNYSSLLVPPYDELWPKEFAPKEPLKMLDQVYNKQFLMEQARSFVWGLQPTISNYQSFLATDRNEEIRYLIDLAKVRSQGLDYLLHGRLLRSPEFEIPVQELDISRLSIYAGKMGESVTSFRHSYPLIYSGTWQSENNRVGIALASISDDPFNVSFSFRSDEYNLPPSGNIYIIDCAGKKLLSSYTDAIVYIDFTLKPEGLCILEIGSIF